MLALIAHDTQELICASEELRADREIVLAALSQDGGALEYAAKELRADKEVVLGTVSQSGNALWCAALKLRADSGRKRPPTEAPQLDDGTSAAATSRTARGRVLGVWHAAAAVVAAFLFIHV